MNEWIVHWRIEWKLLVRGPLLWLLLVIGIVHSWFVLRINEDVTNYAYFIQQFSFIYTAPISIIALLTSIHVARRDRSLKVDCLLHSLPYRSKPMLIVRFVVTTIPFVVLNMASVILFIYFWLFKLQHNVSNAMLLLALTVVAFGISYLTAWGWVIGTWLPGRISYFIGFIFWFVHMYLALLIVDPNLPPAMNGIFNSMILDFKSMGFMDDMWGFMTDLTFWLHRSWYMALTVLLISCLIRHVARRRKEAMSRLRMNMMIGLSGLLAVTMLLGYVFVRSERVAGYTVLARSIQGELPSANSTNIEEIPFQVSRYDIQFVYGEPEVTVTSKLDILNEHQDSLNELTFTLKDTLHIDSANLNEKKVTFQRVGNIVKIKLHQPLPKGESFHLMLTYSGEIDDWRVVKPYGNNLGHMILPVHMATAEKLFVPGDYGWYPLPGSHQLVREIKNPYRINDSGLEDNYPKVGQSDYRVTVDYPSSLTLFSNLPELKRKVKNGRQVVTYEGNEIDGCTLVGGPFLEVSSMVKDKSGLRAIISPFMDEPYIQHLLHIAKTEYIEINRIFQIKRSTPLTLLPYDPIRGSQNSNIGGMMTVDGYWFDLRQLDGAIKRDFITEYIRYLVESDADYFNGLLLSKAIDSYFDYKSSKQPLFILETDSNEEKQLLKYINGHNEIEIETMLQKMYQYIKSNPKSKLPLDELLS